MNDAAGRRLGPDARRTEILDAAVRVYAHRPYAAVSSAEVAREAGVTRGLLHHYFGTKHDLYLEALRVLLTIPERTADDVRGTTAAHRAGAAVDWFLDSLESRPGLWFSVGVGGALGDPAVDAVVEEADEVAVDRVLSVFVPDPGPGGADDEVRRARVRAWFGLVRAASREWLVRGALDRAGVRDLLTATLPAATHLPRSPSTPGPRAARHHPEDP